MEIEKVGSQFVGSITSKSKKTGESRLKEPQDKVELGSTLPPKFPQLIPPSFQINAEGKTAVIIEGSKEVLAQAKEDIIAHGGKIKRELQIINGFSADVELHYLEELRRNKALKVMPDGEMKALLDIASPTIKATQVNTMGYTGKGKTICLIDTGIQPHKDFTDPKTGKSRIIAFKDFVNNRTEPYDDNSHGTHCAGDAAGNGLESGGKYVGPASEANLIGVKVLDGNGSGSFSDVIAGIQWAVENKEKYGIDIISMSLGGYAQYSWKEDPVAQAVEKAVEAGITTVIAAGNSGPTAKTIATPGIAPNVITVGAFNDMGTLDRKDDKIASFSSRGPTRIDNLTKPDIVSPGYDIMATSNKGGYKSLSGTSMATPIVAGVVACLLQANNKLSPKEVKEVLMKTAEDRGLDPNTQGAGYIDAEKAIKEAINRK